MVDKDKFSRTTQLVKFIAIMSLLHLLIGVAVVTLQGDAPGWSILWLDYEDDIRSFEFWSFAVNAASFVAAGILVSKNRALGHVACGASFILSFAVVMSATVGFFSGEDSLFAVLLFVLPGGFFIWRGAQIPRSERLSADHPQENWWTALSATTRGNVIAGTTVAALLLYVLIGRPLWGQVRGWGLPWYATTTRIEDRFEHQLRVLREYALTPNGAEDLLAKDQGGGTHERLFGLNEIRAASIEWTKDTRTGLLDVEASGCTMHEWLQVKKPSRGRALCLHPEPEVGESCVRSCTSAEHISIDFCEHVPVGENNSALISLRVDPRSLR